MTNKTILITGGTDGIGKATALQLAQRGHHLTIVGRNKAKGQQAAQEITQKTGASVEFVSVDMSLMRDVQQFAEAYRASHPSLDILVHSAGVMMSERVVTDEGFEMTFATQYLSRYWLTELLMPALDKSDKGQVFFVSSGRTGDGNLNYDNLNGEQKYSAFSALQTSSSALSLYTLSLMNEYPLHQVYNYGPGLVRSSLGRNMPANMNAFINTVGRLFSISVEQAAKEITTLLTETHESGFYQRGLKQASASSQSYLTQQNRLLQTSNKLIHPYTQSMQQETA